MRRAWPLALAGAGLFVLSCLLARGGPLGTQPYGDVYLYARYSANMTHGHWPYRDFFDEYPPLAQPLFLGVRLLPGSFEPAFRWTMTVLGAGAVALMVGALAAVRAARRRLAVAAITAGVAPLLVGPIFLNAYDLWPALLTAAALFAFVRRHDRTAYWLLALAVAAKIYPIVLLPLALVEAHRRGGRDAVRRGLAWFAGVFAVVNLPFALLGPGGLGFSYWVQLRRGLEVESLAGSVLLALDRLGLRHTTLVASLSTNVGGGLASALATLTSLVAIVAVLVVAWLQRRGRRDLLVAAAAAVVAFVAFGKVFSPQYVDWLVPLVPAAGAVASGLLVGVLALTHVVFERFHSPGSPNGDHYKSALAWWVFARDVLLVLLYALLVLRLRRNASSSSA
ncbi:MAG: glycosyltransferase 87 family protein [Gaiellaceae bacterium]